MENLACSVLRRYLERLKVSSVDPTLLACKLRVAEIITDKDVRNILNKDLPASERWGDLVMAVMTNSTEGIYQKFIDVLLEEKELEHLGKEMKDAYLQDGGVWKKEVHQTLTVPQRREVERDTSEELRGQPVSKTNGKAHLQQTTESLNVHLPTMSNKMAVVAIPKDLVPQKQCSNPTLKSQMYKTTDQCHPEQEEEDFCVFNVVRTVASFNKSPDKLKYQERLNYIGKIKQYIAKVSMNPQEWPASYLSQNAIQKFLMLVVKNCIKKKSLEECIPTERVMVAVKEIVEPIDLDRVQDLPFKKFISKQVYDAEAFPPLMDCKNMLSLHKYFQHALDHMQHGSSKITPSSILQPDISTGMTTALAKVICSFRNYLRKAEQKYEELFVVTMLLPLNYDVDQQVFSTLISVRDVQYLCNQFGQYCKDFFEVIKQCNPKRSQAYLSWLALEIQKNLNIPNSEMQSILKGIEKKIGKDIDPEVQQILLQLSSRNYEWVQCQSQLESLCYHEEKKRGLPATPSGKQQCTEFFSVLGLTDFYPQGLTLNHALEIREDTLECVKHLQDTGSSIADKGPMTKAHRHSKCTDPKQYPSLVLQKIMAFDYKCRTKLVLSSQLYSDQCTITKTLSVEKCVGKTVTEVLVHPMDGLLAVLHCANNFLRQDLMSRLTTCQLAVPLLLPDPFEPRKLTFPLWAMRSIAKEWHTVNSTSKEGQLVCEHSPLVCFLRIGEFKVSKSYLMNVIISESKHDVFFHYNCDGGFARQLLVNGLVEVCWYLPSKDDIVFSNLVTFANLHGDARECPKQVKFFRNVSFMNFVFIDEDNQNKEALNVLQDLAAAPGGLVLLQVNSSDDSDKWFEWLKPIKKSVQVINLADRNEAAFREKVHEEINSRINEKWNAVESNFSLEKQSNAAHLCDICVDEDEIACIEGRRLAHAFESIVCNFRERKIAESQNCGVKSHNKKANILKNLLPLQGSDLWHEWALTEKEEYRQAQRGQCEVEVYSQQQRKKMEDIRKEQLKHIQPLNSLMESFLAGLLNHQENTRHYFLQWIKFFLDNLAREQLPDLHNQYKHKVFELQTIQSENKVAEGRCKVEIQRLNDQITDASFGLEHLLREVSQIYEAVATLQQEVPPKYLHLLHLPEVAAQLMIDGYPLELMDGNATHVPTTWVSAVLSKLQELLKSSRVFVLSVLGTQSSGKSTLMNTVFGVRFNTSAGRCTRGAFMQLLPIHSSLRPECQCDYFLIVDTEGLRAPELAHLTLKHDNELATFVIGLANLTIINLSGETVGDMDDILQTAVHAFLRMKRVKLKPRCHFVHQNVTAVKAGEKTMMSYMKFKEALDMKTQAAAKEEGVEDKYKHFTDALDFDSEKHVSRFQTLWKGDPPMAPINPGYSSNAQCLKLCLITHAKEAYSTDLKSFQRHLKALWQAILHENFVFSFKNTLEVIAYNTLDGAYGNWSWHFKEEMMTWEQKAHNKMKSCEIPELSSVYGECIDKLPNQVQNIHDVLKEEMILFFKKNPQQEIIIKWKGVMEIRLEHLKMQLQQQAEDHCKFWMTNREALAKVDEMKVTHRTFIFNHVKLLASQLEKGQLNDEQLEEKFKEQWIVCIKELECVPVHMVEVHVKIDVQKCLTDFELLRPSQPMVIEKIKKEPLGSKNCFLQLKVRDVHVKERPVYKMRCVQWGTEHPTKEGQLITDMLLDNQKHYLQKKKERHYNSNLATDLLRKLFDEIMRNSTDITFTEEYKVDMALAVCQYAIVVFQEMVDTETRKNDPVEYLEREVRGPFLKLFKDEYHQIAREVTAATAICDLLQRLVENEVIGSLSPKIAGCMRGACSFLHTKPALKAKVLLDIGNHLNEHSEGHFAHCLCYLTNVEESLCFWLEQYTLQYCCEGKLADIAFTVVLDIVELIRDTVRKISKEFSLKGGDFKITEWLAKFHSEIQKSGTLPLDETELYQLVGVHYLKDFAHFTAEVMKGLKGLQFALEKKFEAMSFNEMSSRWEKRPHDHLFEALAGCTEQCPFCKEQCDCTTAKHLPSAKHSVALHRPQCLGSYRIIASGEMVLDICTSDVGSDHTFRNKKTNHNSHYYKQYSDIYPEWSIPADMSLEASLYWKWLVGHFANEITHAFNMKLTAIPEEWKKLQWCDVKRKLADSYNV